MNKILNWTFGSLFRTIGRLLGFLIVCILLVLIGSKLGLKIPDFLMPMKISAASLRGWASELPALSRVEYKSCSSKNSCSDSLYIETDFFETPQIYRSFITNAENSAMNIGSNGYIIQTPAQGLKAGYLYNINYYICSSKTLSNATFDIYGTTYADGYNDGNIFTSVKSSSISTTPIIDGGRTFNGACYLFIGLFVPDKDYTWSAFRVTSSSVINNVYLSTIAVEQKELGLYTSTVKDLIDNSGFATADSVQEVQDSVDQVQEQIKETQDTITNNDSSGATGEAGGFFENFNTETFGLTSIITAPLNAINNILTSSCSSLSIPLPFVNKNIVLPCMTTIYSNYFGAFFQLYQLITTGIISYYIIVRIFNLVKDFKNPEHDEIEVVDL